MPEYCPVRNFETYLQKLHPQCNRLWQFPKDSFNISDECWFQKRPIGKAKTYIYTPFVFRIYADIQGCSSINLLFPESERYMFILASTNHPVTYDFRDKLERKGSICSKFQNLSNFNTSMTKYLSVCVVIVFWGPNEGDRKRTYIPRLFSEYMLTFRVE
jgi:hypothetical protein